MPGLLDWIGALGAGAAAGGETARKIEEEKRRRAEAQRTADEYDRQQRERASTNKALFDLYDTGRQDQQQQVAEGLTDAGGALEALPQTGPFDAMPFAGAGLKGASAKVAEAAQQKGQFDPDANYGDLVNIQTRIADLKDRATDRRERRDLSRQSQARLAEESASRNATRKAAMGDEVGIKNALKRMVTSGTLKAFSPEDIDGLSLTTAQKLLENAMRGDTNTEDRNQQYTFRIENPAPPKSRGTGSGPDNSLAVSDLNTAVTQQQKAFDDLLASAPKVLTDAFPAFRRGQVHSVEEVMALVNQLPRDARMKDNAGLTSWLSRLQRTQALKTSFGDRRDNLLTEGTRKESGLPPEPAPRRPGASAPAPAAAPDYSKDQWTRILASAEAALKADPNDEEAKQAVADAKRALGGR